MEDVIYVACIALIGALTTYSVFSESVRDNLIQRVVMSAISFMSWIEVQAVITDNIKVDLGPYIAVSAILLGLVSIPSMYRLTKT